MNDNGGAGFTPSTYTLSQAVLLPLNVSSLDLSFAFSSISGYSGASRTFTVDFLQSGTLIGNAFTYTVPLTDNDSAWTLVSLDVFRLLSSYEGQSVELRFSNFIPQSWTGPAGLGLDDVSVQAEVAVPEPSSLGLLGLGLAVGYLKRRKRGLFTTS